MLNATTELLTQPTPASYPSPPKTATPVGRATSVALVHGRRASSAGASARPLPRPTWTGIAFALSIGATMLTGCAIGPNYSRPAVATATSWKEAQVTTSAPVLPQDWWTIFKDAELDALEIQAVHANQDLKRAVARVSEARAIARVSKADLYPGLTQRDGYTRTRSSENSDNQPLKRATDDFSSTFDLSYELDLFGRVRRNIEAATADLAATETDLQTVLLTLTADVARNYQILRSLDTERVVIEGTIALRKDAVQLQETRAQAGLKNEMDLTRARTELANVEAELQGVIRSRAQIEHALALLCGQPPADFALAPKASTIVPPEIPVGLPSELLQRRPDIVVAEHNLEAANARIGVAKAAIFPTIKLTGTAGFASADLGSLVDWPSRLAQFGPSISVPIFSGGRNTANLKAAEARYEQNVALYRGAVLKAFREVEDSLSDLSTLAVQGDAVRRALVSARDTATLATERYQKGLTSYLDVVDAQRAALQAERQDTQLRSQRAVSTILLAKALGGGWDRTSTPQLAQAN